MVKKISKLTHEFESFGLTGEFHVTKTMLITISLLTVSILFIVTSNNNVFQIVLKLIKLLSEF